MVERLFLAMPWGCLRFVIVVFPDHTYLLFFMLYMIFSFRVKSGKFAQSVKFGQRPCLFHILII